MLLLPGLMFTPIEFTGEVVTTARPTGASGAFITLMGRGGLGANGGHVANTNQSASGGVGGGGGSYIARVFMPAYVMGDTWALTLGNGTIGARFTTGAIVLDAGWGVGRTGGVATATGFTDVALADGGLGGLAGNGTGNGSPGASTTNGAGSGGGGGGGARSSPGATTVGGNAGSSVDPGRPGYKGGNGTGRVGNGADGGDGGAGGGWTAATSQTVPGIAYARVEWV